MASKKVSNSLLTSLNLVHARMNGLEPIRSEAFPSEHVPVPN